MGVLGLRIAGSNVFADHEGKASYQWPLTGSSQAKSPAVHNFRFLGPWHWPLPWKPSPIRTEKETHLERNVETDPNWIAQPQP